jgi:hypothetical protein
MMLRICAGSATPVEPVASPEPGASVQRRGPFRKDCHRCRRALPTERPRATTPPDRYSLILRSGRKPTPFPTRRFRQWRKRWLPTSSAALEYRGCYSDQGRNFKTRSRNRTAWSIATSKRWRSTKEK